MSYDHVRELLAHQAWADAELWRALEACPAALADPDLRERQHHIHLVQRAFLAIVRGEPVVATSPGDFASMKALREHAREGHAAIATEVAGLTPALFGEVLQIPWFREPPLRLTRSQALLQMALHSQYHRGQNATRLRQLGGEPPPVDLILWYWQGRPAARWP